MRLGLTLAAGIVAVLTWPAVLSSQDRVQKAKAPSSGYGPEHAHLQNSVEATPASVAAGKKLYDTQCAGCHGVSGKGDGKMAASITKGPKPSDLTDTVWKHGSTDGDIHTIIRNGSEGTGMRGVASRMKTEDIWNVVNYLRTLSVSPQQPPH